MDDDIYPIQTDTDQEEVAHLFRRYGLVEAPVVSESGRLVGVITISDVVDRYRGRGRGRFHAGGRRV